MKALIEWGADAIQRGPGFGTALDAARYWDNERIAEQLHKSSAIDGPCKKSEKVMSSAMNWAGRDVFPVLFYDDQPPPLYA